MTSTIETPETVIRDRFGLNPDELRKRLNVTDAELQAALAREQVLERTRSFIAHEFRNTIVPLNVYAQMLAEEVAKPEPDRSKLSKLTGRIIKHTNTASDIVDEYIDYSRPLKPDFQMVDIESLLRNVAAGYETICAAQNIEIFYKFYVSVKAEADPQMLAQVFRELIENAIEAMARGGYLIIEAMPFQDSVIIGIGDEGEGVAEEYLPHAFKLGYTTKLGRRSAGLGLALSRRIIEAHNGTITIENKPSEKGARVIIALPVSHLVTSRDK
jgi:signal transduction histidine kinase